MEEFDQRPPSCRNKGPFSRFKEQENIGLSCKQKEEEEEEEDEGGDAEMEFVTDTFAVQRPSLTERRAGRVGFDAPAINTSGVRVAEDFHSSSLEIRAPYLTIPSGLSPTTLLDSPMFLSNLQDQPSPTTGSFPSVQEPQKSKPLEGINRQSSDLKPRMELIPFTFPSRGNQPQPGSTMDLHQFLPSMEASVGHQQGSNLSSIKASTDDVDTYHKLSHLCRGNDRSPPPDGSQEEETRGETSSFGLGGLAEDGYNWRKYGQKQVKGSEYPRSYYKCTNLNCQVKKKVERNHEGQVTEIIYKGTHNHQKPLTIHRPGFPSYSSNEFQVEGHDWRKAIDIEGAPPASVTKLDSNDEDEDQVTHGSSSLGCDGEDEESEAKKRKLDVCSAEMSANSRAAREQKVVVQTTSEVDILEDGYRWRKYGQKVVKGNPNPRSYYKCTHPSCTVRKHVERASHDLKAVITTYEGKHNHEVPVSRCSGSAAPAAAAAAAQPSRLQNSFSRLDTPGLELVAGFGQHGREQVRPAATNFSFAPGPRGLPMPGYRHMALLPAANAYLGQHRAAQGLLLPKGEPQEEPVLRTGRGI